LGYAVPGEEHMGFVRQVVEYYLNFSTVVCVDYAAVHKDPLPRREAGARS